MTEYLCAAEQPRNKSQLYSGESMPVRASDIYPGVLCCSQYCLRSNLTAAIK